MDYIIDATDQRLGRLASHIAILLQGKETPAYHPRIARGGRIVVKNASRITVSGEKSHAKIYYRHTGYMGHLRKKTFEQLFSRSPENVLYRAVFNMLPKNKLRPRRLRTLTIER